MEAGRHGDHGRTAVLRVERVQKTEFAHVPILRHPMEGTTVMEFGWKLMNVKSVHAQVRAALILQD